MAKIEKTSECKIFRKIFMKNFYASSIEILKFYTGKAERGLRFSLFSDNFENGNGGIE